jgi:hypothetical protein
LVPEYCVRQSATSGGTWRWRCWHSQCRAQLRLIALKSRAELQIVKYQPKKNKHRVLDQALLMSCSIEGVRSHCKLQMTADELVSNSTSDLAVFPNTVASPQPPFREARCFIEVPAVRGGWRHVGNHRERIAGRDRHLAVGRHLTQVGRPGWPCHAAAGVVGVN